MKGNWKAMTSNWSRILVKYTDNKTTKFTLDYLNKYVATFFREACRAAAGSCRNSSTQKIWIWRLNTPQYESKTKHTFNERKNIFLLMQQFLLGIDFRITIKFCMTHEMIHATAPENTSNNNSKNSYVKSIFTTPSWISGNFRKKKVE